MSLKEGRGWGPGEGDRGQHYNFTIILGKSQQTGKNGHEAHEETLFFQPNI